MQNVWSDPKYTKRHAGPVIVAGGAACLHDDIAAARSLRATAPILAVNRAGAIIPNVLGMVTAHGDKADLYDIPHGVPFHDYPSDQRAITRRHSRIDYLWHGPTAAVGTSSLCAVLVALAIGFDEVILCGVPLMKTGYVPGSLAMPTEFTDNTRKDTGTLQTRRDAWSRFKAAGNLPRVYSVSGVTREILGVPPMRKGN